MAGIYHKDLREAAGLLRNKNFIAAREILVQHFSEARNVERSDAKQWAALRSSVRSYEDHIKSAVMTISKHFETDKQREEASILALEHVHNAYKYYRNIVDITREMLRDFRQQEIKLN